MEPAEKITVCSCKVVDPNKADFMRSMERLGFAEFDDVYKKMSLVDAWTLEIG